MKPFLSFILVLFCSIYTSAFAQTITGKVLDEQSQPIEFANVILLSLPDSAMMASAATDASGSFTIIIKGKSSSKSTHQLIVSYLGYKPEIIQLNNTLQTIDLGKIFLTPKTKELNEVTIKGARTIIKTDRQIIFPQRQMIENSTNGYDLLKRMMLAGLKIDVVQQSIEKSNGGNVALYINDKKATTQDVVALLPDEVLRVEYIDVPGVQYANDNVETVINFIVKRRSSGLVAGLFTTNAVTIGNGRNMCYVKLNNKLSEFGFTYSVNYGATKGRLIDQTDRYILADGKENSIERHGIPSSLKFSEQQMQLTYNLSVPDKYVFEINLSGTFYDSPDRASKQFVTESGKDSYYTHTAPTEKYHSPVLDLFYKVNLPKKQSLTFNLVGTFIDTEYGYTYEKYASDQFVLPIEKYGYNTLGKKYSLIGETRYNKQFKPFLLTMGINHFQGYTENKYSGTDNVTTEMMNANSYAYSQIKGKLSKINYSIGLGISHQNYLQGNDKYTYWLFRPSATLSYKLRNINIRYNFSITPNLPSLSYLGNVRQQKTDMEFIVGNPSLKPYNSVNNKIILSYDSKRLSIENTIGFSNRRNAIMDNIVRKADNVGNTFFELGYSNQKSMNTFWNYTNAQFYIIPDKLVVQGGLSYSRYFSNGNEYKHIKNFISSSLQSELYLGKWTAGTGWYSRSGELSGESVHYRSNNSNIYLNYRFKSINLGIDWSYIFSKKGDNSGDETINKYLNKSSWVSVPGLCNKISIVFSWKLTKGREYQSQDKTLYNSDDESGILK